MEIEQLNQTDKIDATIKAIIAGKKKGYKDALKEFDVMKHDVFNTSKRRDKTIETDAGPEDVKVNRVGIPFQEIIVNRAASFLIGKPVELDASPDEGSPQEALLAMVKKTWQDNKLDYKSKKLAKLMMSETECAEIWYAEDAEKGYWEEIDAQGNLKMRMKIIAPSLGDTLYPIFDSSGNMIGFGHGYTVLEGKKNIEHFTLYTDTAITSAKKENGIWVSKEEKIEHNVGKIPVIYYNQPRPEWATVQKIIERIEILLSNYADTNDYFGAPIVKVTGEVEGFAKKGDQGKVLVLKAGSEADYLTWDNAPEAIKLELDTLFDIVFSFTQTPNITFKEVKGLGDVSGVAMDLLFMDADMKAKDKQEDVFGECIQRRVNFLKVAMGEINDKVKKVVNFTIIPRFGLFRPDNVSETLNLIMTATGNKQVMSRDSGVRANPMVKDPEKELILLDLEAVATKPKLGEEFDQ